MLGAILGAVSKPIDTLIDRLIPDPVEREKAKREMQLALLAEESKIRDAAASVVLAEAKSEHWLTAAWRPILMLIFAAIIANNYILAPYIDAMFGAGLQLDLPDRMWDLLTVGVGGYVGGRSLENTVKAWKGGAE